MLITATPAPDSCTYAHDVARGGRAPCAGVLVPPPVARECVRLQISVVPRLRLQLDESAESCRVGAVTAAGRLASCSAESLRLHVLLRTASTPPVRPWYEAPAVVAVTAAVVGIALGAAVVYGVTR